MTRDSRHFPLADVLSITTGRLLTRRTPHPGQALDDLLHHMTGDRLAWWQAPRAADACTQTLVEQHPFLASLRPLPGSDTPDLYAWLLEAERRHGQTLTVVPLTDWVRQDPAQELLDQVQLAHLPVLHIDPAAREAALARATAAMQNAVAAFSTLAPAVANTAASMRRALDHASRPA